MFNVSSLVVENKEDAIEIVSMKGLTVSLLASGDGTEVIHHHLQQGTRWGMVPIVNWSALEFFFLLKGKLKIHTKDQQIIIIETGYYGRANPIKEHVEFIAQEECEFIYVSSQPVFHYYSQSITKMRELAISVEEKDGYTADHCTRIMKLSMLVGEHMKLTPNELYILNLAAFLHDVGKIVIPEEILLKPGKLTNEEYDIIKTHASAGKELLEETGFPDLIEAGKIVEQHHERYDGKGYPNNLQKEFIDIRASIITVVDSYDAMTSDRVYRKGMSKELALEELKRCSGTMFHPEIVKIFTSLQNKY